MIEIIPRESEAQWLAARRLRVTATDIGRLANGGPSAFRAVRAEKHGEATFHGNIYTRWGHEREPVIMEHLAFLYDLEPNDSLYVNGDRAATPDGVNASMLAEAKTTVNDWWRGDQPSSLAVIRHEKPEYYDQVQWAQLVCERDLTVFAWEPHERFIPGTVQHVEIPRDEKRIAELIEVEAAFREYLTTEQDDDEWIAFLAAYAEAEAAVREATAVLESLKDDLREKQGDTELAVKTPFGSISYAWPKPRETFDATAFKKAHPEMVGEFMRLTPPKAPTLRITTK